MQLEHAKYLYDIQYASGLLAEFVQGKTWQDYEANAMLRAAAERQFEIIGEALAQLARRNGALVEGISGADKPILHRMVDSLYAKGQTKGNKAILFSQLLAQRYFIEGGNNQILMATDGKFSFRVKDQGIWSQRQGTKPVVLSTVAFGGDREAMANLKGIARIGGGSFIHIRKRDGSRDKLLEEVKNRSRR